jgi:hypothetical protein
MLLPVPTNHQLHILWPGPRAARATANPVIEMRLLCEPWPGWLITGWFHFSGKWENWGRGHPNNQDLVSSGVDISHKRSIERPWLYPAFCYQTTEICWRYTRIFCAFLAPLCANIVVPSAKFNAWELTTWLRKCQNPKRMAFGRSSCEFQCQEARISAVAFNGLV